MKKTKYRIYAVAPGKKLIHTLICLTGAFVIFILSTVFFNLSGNDFKKYVSEKSLDNAFFVNNKANKKMFSPSQIKIHTLMQELSPVFASTEKSAYIYSEKSDEPIEVLAKNDEPLNLITGNYTPQIKNETSYSIDTLPLLEVQKNYSAKNKEAKVLIVHTHGCETYSSPGGGGLGEDSTYRTTDTALNMVAIGDAMEEVFKEKGIDVIHDKTLCDYPTYNTSYVKSLSVIDGYLQKYPQIEFVFDIHRDAIVDKEGQPAKTLCKINGEDTAQAMIVCGTDAMGLENPDWRENLALALKIQQKLDNTYPGFMRPVNIRKERFNMHKTKGSLLFEVGTHGNTLDEALKGARYLAEGIVEVIK